MPVSTLCYNMLVGVHTVQTVHHTADGGTMDTLHLEVCFSLKIQGVDISPPTEFPHSFHTIVSGMTNR